ncbi:MAG: carboxypeptidase regulatory-like domain-containing protein [candidate division NC10 bacterium]
MRRYFVVAISGLVCAAVVWAMVPGTARAGTIKGTVRLAGAPVKPKKVPVTIDQYVCGKEKEAEDLILLPDNGIRYAVVSLQTPPPGAKWNAPLPPAQIDQKQCAFVPRVVVVPAGGTVEFLNSDRLLHNVKSFSKANSPFNKAHPKARTISIVFKEPEIIRIECDLHSWMRTWVVVAGHPFHAVTNDKGEFALDNVPPGKYTLQIWQESLGTVTREVTVGDTSAATVTVEMSRK